MLVTTMTVLTLKDGALTLNVSVFLLFASLVAAVLTSVVAFVWNRLLK